MSDSFYGEIKAFPYTFSPSGWIPCDGRELPVQQYPALYAVIGNTYGGTPNVSLKVPNLNGAPGGIGRAVQGAGQIPNVSSYPLGSTTGTPSVTLTPAQMPQHNHTISAINAAATVANPTNQSHLCRYLATPGVDYTYSSNALTVNNYLDPGTLSPAGAPSPTAHDNNQPYQTFMFCICASDNNAQFPVRE